MIAAVGSVPHNRAALRRGEPGLVDALAAALQQGAVVPHPVDMFRANARGLAADARALGRNLGKVAAGLGDRARQWAGGTARAMAFQDRDAAPDANAALEQLAQAGGEPLSLAVRIRMEALFGHRFAHVRVHTDAAAVRAAEAAGAGAGALLHHVGELVGDQPVAVGRAGPVSAGAEVDLAALGHRPLPGVLPLRYRSRTRRFESSDGQRPRTQPVCARRHVVRCDEHSPSRRSNLPDASPHRTRVQHPPHERCEACLQARHPVLPTLGELALSGASSVRPLEPRTLSLAR